MRKYADPNCNADPDDDLVLILMRSVGLARGNGSFRESFQKMANAVQEAGYARYGRRQARLEVVLDSARQVDTSPAKPLNAQAVVGFDFWRALVRLSDSIKAYDQETELEMANSGKEEG